MLLAIDATPATLPLVAARLLLATFFFYFMLGLSFKAALRTNLLLIGAYAGAALMGKIAPTVAAYSLFVLLCANLIGGAGRWMSWPATGARRSSPSWSAPIAPRRPRPPPTCCVPWRNLASPTMAQAHARTLR